MIQTDMADKAVKVKFEADLEACEFISDAIEFKLAHARTVLDRAIKMNFEDSERINTRKVKVLEDALEVFKAPVVEARNAEAEAKAEARREAKEKAEAEREAKKAEKKPNLTEKVRETVRKAEARKKAKA